MRIHVDPCLSGRSGRVALSILVLITAAPLHGAVLDPAGLPLCVAAGDQFGPRAVPAADGAAIVVWQDRRRGAGVNDLYATSVAADGSMTPGWPADGRVLCASGGAGPPRAVPDGSGGALVLWRDTRDGGQIYAQRVNADGTLAAGWPADGMALTAPGGLSFFSSALYDVVSDGSGGAFFLRHWNSPWTNVDRGVVTRITADGTFSPGWNESSISFAYGSGSTLGSVVLGGDLGVDPSGGTMAGVVVGWDGITFAKVGRISPSGLVWVKDLPHHINEPFEGIRQVSTAGDGSGGGFVTWYEEYPAREFAQHYSTTGATLWPADLDSPTWQAVESDGVGGAYLIGSPVGLPRLEVHRQLPDGSPAWNAAGVTLTQPAAMGTFAAARYGAELFLCWAENRSGGGFGVRAASVSRGGVVLPGWDPDGTVVCDSAGDQTAPQFADMVPQRVLVCWQDARSGGWDIRATRVDLPPFPLGVEAPAVPALALGSPWPNPARDRVSIELSLPGTGAASIDVVDVSGRIVAGAVEVPPGAGRRSVDWNVSGLPNGVYWIRLAHAGRTMARRFAVLH